MRKKISSYIPEIGESLAMYQGKEVIDRLGEQVIKEVVTSVLCGSNIRSLTENLTRRRLILSNASMLITCLHSLKNIDDFPSKIPALVKKELMSSIPEEKKLFLQWLIGLTKKGIQNVLRSDETEFNQYLDNFENSLGELSKKCQLDFGELNGVLQIDDIMCKVNWPFIIYLFGAIGAQTLSIRGSEKSMYGKLFEKLILGSLLTILGFEKIHPDDTSKANRVFWLAARGKKRESDATLLYEPGVGVRFDIGFIGPGNTEISLDKVSRFEREMERGRQKHYLSTIIIVDRIGDRSRIVDMAKSIDGEIVQMSMTYWVKDICEILKNKMRFKHKIQQLSGTQALKYIERKMRDIDLKEFI